MLGGLLRVLGVAMGAGGVVGVALGLTVLADDASAGGGVSAATATAYVCPGDGEVGTLHGGDRVLITGRSGDWLAVRNVRGGLERVFVSSAAVSPDSDLSALPEVSCDLSGTLTLDGATPTTVPTPVPTLPGEATTTSTTAPGNTTTTTTAPPPSVGAPSANPDEIWEKYDGFPSTCPGNGISLVSASVSAPAGVQSVTLSWTSSIGGGAKSMTSGGGTYSASLGPFDAENAEGVALNESITMVATVTVIDGMGRSASGHVNITLNDCSFG